MNTCGFDYSLLTTMLSDHERIGVHVTDLTGCLRRAWYDKVSATPEYVHTRLYRVLGTALHAKLEQGDDDFAQSEVSLSAMGIVGTADVVYEDGRVIDYKTARWLTPSRLPYGSHELQLNIYAELLRQAGQEVTSLAVQYIDMSGPYKCKKCKVLYEPDNHGDLYCPKCGASNVEAHPGVVLKEIAIMDREEIQKLIVERRDTLITSLENNDPPDKEEGWLCNYCNHEPICKI
jgi:CRISPR/Cas system-associated exonuclease Cas4 (RecB family)